MSIDDAPRETARRQRLEVHVGDRIFIPGPDPAAPVRDGLVLQVRRRDGSPPYRVRWSDTHYVSLVDPGPDAYVNHHDYDPEAT
ncbi:DUF1918 domain-containing protein [Nocardioides panacisoli]|uniref:DUF1918 domain-containing protein n=1 Tax=Nocardioides panacisoli TaxID=627624 RepID=UPI001C6303CB|nr:DUF1918 domain-containing protein [Nocardioides panacisoli]QYJ05405.1 DUF1918 domain-containing protein [Nocardioides panacisoli]